MADENKISKINADQIKNFISKNKEKEQGRKKQSKPKAGLGLLGSPKGKEPEVLIMQMVEEGPANKHKSLQLKKMKKTENSKGDIEIVDLKAKGGRAGYSVGGKAIKGVSKILLKK